MSGHGRLICESCSSTISRCRCPNHNSVKFSICNTCRVVSASIQSDITLQTDLTRLQDTVNSIRDLDFETIAEYVIRPLVTPDSSIEAIAAAVGDAIEEQIDKIISDGIN